MEFRAHKAYKLKNFEIGQIAKAIKSFLQYYSLDCEGISYSLYYQVNDIEWNDRVQFKDLYKITDLSRELHTLVFMYNVEGNRHDFYVDIENKGDNLYLGFGAPTLEDAQNNIALFEHELGLSEIEKENHKSIDIKEELQRINEKLLNLEQKINKVNNMRCFISYRFNERTEKYILELTRFLNMMGIEVITGSDYEPRRISEKVTDKLNMVFDFIIYVVTQEGESMWCRDELGTSYGKGCRIIPIVEDGCKLESGILSDWEFISFRPNHIGDIFVKLLEGINFIKKQKEIIKI